MAQALAGLGALHGTVTDPSGAVVTNAHVVISNDAIGLKHDLTSSSEGLFQAASLPPSEGYKLTVTKPGFSAFVAAGIAVHVGQDATLNVTLTIEQAVQDIQVNASASVLDVSRLGVSQLVSQKEINDLPINGRRVDQFVLLTPGVTTDGANGEVTYRGVPGNNLFLQDGMDVTQQWGQDNAGSTNAFSPISQDAVQEFQVETSNYSAEFGHAAGGIVNTLTKSGTNSYHGGAFWFYKNRTLNATDPYSLNNGKPFNPPNWRHQVGGSIGGPIIKGKLFFFGNTEEIRESRPLVSSYAGSNLVNSDGTFKDGVCNATEKQCAAAQTYVRRSFAVLKRTLNENVGFAKLDWHPTEKESLTVNFNLMQFSSPNGTVTASALTDGSGFYPNGDQIDLTRWARFSYTRVVSPRAVNEFRFGWFKDTRKQSINPAIAPSNGIRSGLSVGDMSNLGMSVNIPNSQPSEDRFLFTDTFSLLVGRHQLKLGVETNYMRDVENALFYARGEYFYGDLSDWAEDLTPDTSDVNSGRHYSGFLQSFGPLLTRAIVRDYNFYIQDQWQVTRDLTLNLGMRYEFNRFTQPPENPDYPATGKLNEPLANFAPRIGFAYSTRQGSTVFRGGFGISYARLPSASIIRLQQRNGVIQKTIFFEPNTTGAPRFPSYLSSTNIPGAGSNVTWADPGLKTPYTEQADFTVEQKLDTKTRATISYLWNNGVGFLTRKDENLVAPTSSYAWRILDSSGSAQTGTYTTPLYTATYDTRYGVLNHIYNGGMLFYDGLAITLIRQQTSWVQGALAYTWSHAIDLGLGSGADNIYYTDPPVTVFNGNQRFEKGNSSLDQRHRLVLSGSVTPPMRPFQSHLANITANGWELSLIETYATPQGVDPYVNISALPAALAKVVYASTISGVGIGFESYQRVPFYPRSSLELGTTFRTDARLTKQFKIAHEQRLAMNFELFNAFNYRTITSVNQVAVVANVDGNGNGILVPVPKPGRGTASAGFPDGTNARRAQVSIRYSF
ncbi:TonB-dependent receptor [Terriglobus sp. TAA 43]|uniref:TonB-dependent receptor n=1 Tax=Terriglobus sp. TAA 43 TaxID=278961 RepID=UPI0006488819|nr:carboxypeptidase regulatory-like domain-containing protein [Terriglobus sp. TAA 43]